jgi:uncharacterized protein
MIRLRKLGLALAFLTATACESEAPVTEIADATVEFGRGAVTIVTDTDTLSLEVDVAESDAQRARGLMQRESLGESEGMIFLFAAEQPAEGTFYMYNTLIPLSIAFLDEEGRIGSIRHMEPCTSPYAQWCHQYAAGVPFHAALEVNEGYFEAHGVELGDRVIFQP